MCELALESFEAFIAAGALFWTQAGSAVKEQTASQRLAANDAHALRLGSREEWTPEVW